MHMRQSTKSLKPINDYGSSYSRLDGVCLCSQIAPLCEPDAFHSQTASKRILWQLCLSLGSARLNRQELCACFITLEFSLSALIPGISPKFASGSQQHEKQEDDS